MSYHFPDGTGLMGAELRKTADITGFGMLLMFGGGIYLSKILSDFISFLLTFASLPINPEAAEEVAVLFSYIVSFALPIVAVTLLTRTPLTVAFPFTKPRSDILIPGVLLCLGISVFGNFISGILSYLIQSISGYTPIMPDLSLPSGTASIAFYIVSTAVAPAFLEEMLFRGAILQSLRRFGDGFALVASSILFAIAHGNLVQGPNSLLMGIAIGFFVLRSGSLWSGIAIHFVNNIIIVIFELVMRNSSTAQYNLASVQLVWSYIFCGVLALTAILPRHPGFFRIPPSSASSVSVLTKHRIFFTSAMPVAALIAAALITSLYFTPS